MDAAVAAYTGMWLDMAEAAKTSDYRSPLLARHATGSALRRIVESLYLDDRAGLVSRGRPVLHPQVTRVDLEAYPALVLIDDCGDSRNWLHHRRSGGLADDKPGGRRHITATVAGHGQTWKVVDFQVGEVGSC